MRTFGYVKSKLTGNELKADNFVSRVLLPVKYDLTNLSRVRDQGNIPKCVSVALTDIVYWNLKSSGITPNIDDNIFYDHRHNKPSDGMDPKDAFELLTTYHITKYNYSSYALVGSYEVAKRCILQFGPVMICLPVRSYADNFWIGNDNYGGHAVLLTGYDETGFILRNSWGYSFGNNGYIKFPYDCFNLAYESWTLIK